MKIFYAISGFMLLVQTNFLPKTDLLLLMGLSLVLDFITGVTKAVMAGEKRTSLGFRKTIIKFIQYGSAILIGMGISYMGSQISEYNKDWKSIETYMSWFNNGLLILIIFIEVVSILENINSINKTSLFARKVIQPALKVLTIKINENPVMKLTVEAKETEKITVTEKTIPKTDA